MNKFYPLVFLSLLLLSACGGSSTNNQFGTDAAQVALDKISEYAQTSGSSEPPQLSDYTDAGVQDVDDTNLTLINEGISGSNELDVDTVAEIQALVEEINDTSIVSDTTQAALDKISEYAQTSGSSEPPRLLDYVDAGVQDVNGKNLTLINESISGSNELDVDTVAQIQALVEEINGISTDSETTQAALDKISEYAQTSGSSEAPQLSDYTDAGVQGVDSTNITLINEGISGSNELDVDTVAQIQALVEEINDISTDSETTQAALDKISEYAQTSGSSEAPQLTDYIDARVQGVDDANLTLVNEKIAESEESDVDTAVEIQAIVNELSDSSTNVIIESVFLAQTHVLSPDDPLFKLVGNRDALLKVQIIDADAGSAPEVSVELNLSEVETETLTLQGPATLPVSFDGTLGLVQHQFSDSFTVVIPKEWVKPSLQIRVIAGDANVSHNINVGAPNALTMDMFDIHYFGEGEQDYPAGTFAELEQKWPVSSLNVNRIRDIDFPEMVIPARADVNAPHVRITSIQDYFDQTGLRIDGEEIAALRWAEALANAGGKQPPSSSMNLTYINILGTSTGGIAGIASFNGTSNPGPSFLHHELGHALSLPHWGAEMEYPYKGDMHGITAPDTVNSTHVGPTWAFDLPSMTFIPPTVGPNTPRGTEGQYKASPMQGGGTGDQESSFILRHFSDYGVNQMQNTLEERLLFQRGDDWFKWDQTTGEYSDEVTSELGILAPIETDVDVISLMFATTIADMDINMIYTPIGPYEGNLLRTFDPDIETDRVAARGKYCTNNGCDFSVRVTQGSTTNTYMLASSSIEGLDEFSRVSLKTVAINLPASDGEIRRVELLLTPNAEINGLPDNPEVLDTKVYSEVEEAGFSWNDPSVQSCTNTADGPVKVFILAGQSNMSGHGIISPTQAQLDKNSGEGTLENLATQPDYSYLRAENGDWLERDDVWVAYKRQNRFTESLTVGWGASEKLFGLELEFGRRMADLYDNQVLLIKVPWGGTSLAEDWRPPSSGNTVGPRYNQMFEEVEEILTNLESHFPSYQGQGFEIAGFAWNQGWADRINDDFYSEYQENMVNFINDVRNELDNEDLPFVLGVTGVGGRDETNARAISLVQQQLAVPDDSNLNNSNVATVETRDFYFDEENSPLNEKLHWNKNAESYILIGEGFAETMKPLICQ